MSEHRFTQTSFLTGVCVCVCVCVFVCVLIQHVYIFYFPHLASDLAPAYLAVLCQEGFSLFTMKEKEMK